ncbi:MAG TPA: glycosyltransferase [Acidimicrobiales bacterium]|nr:glycosyltransferase [Acidimicrobiales bacterium]
MTTDVALVVPVFDEDERLAEYGETLVAFIACQPAGSELVFVDDGSSDGTAAAVEALIAASPGLPVRLLRRQHQGKGGAVAAGLASTTASYAAFCDLDLSTPLEQLERIIAAATRAPVLAVGSRDLSGSRVTRPEGRVREALGRTYNRLLQATITPGIVDTQCGAKAASAAVWRAVLPHCRERGFAWDAEAIAVAGALGIGVQEVPVEWRHDERSKVNVVRDGTAMVWATARIWRRARHVRAGQLPSRTPVAAASPGTTGAGVFDGDNAALLMATDRDHWWFRSKAAFVATALRRATASESTDGWLVDAGAGAGGVTAMLGWAPDRVVVAEGSHRLVAQAHRHHGLPAVQAGVDHLPLATGTAEVVCLLDVIEHLAGSVPALVEARRVLADGGHLVVNVPAHRWLWSAADEALGHVRRYNRRTLRAELVAAGFEPLLMTHVFSWLVGPVWLKRRLASGGDAELGLDQTSFLIDRAAMVLTLLERLLIGRVPLPFGTSLLCVAVPRR